jgi:hypothetical protein
MGPVDQAVRNGVHVIVVPTCEIKDKQPSWLPFDSSPVASCTLRAFPCSVGKECDLICIYRTVRVEGFNFPSRLAHGTPPYVTLSTGAIMLYLIQSACEQVHHYVVILLADNAARRATRLSLPFRSAADPRRHCSDLAQTCVGTCAMRWCPVRGLAREDEHLRDLQRVLT